MEHGGAPVKPPGAQPKWEQPLLDHVTKNAIVMERTTLRHLTQEEIALNQQELTCRAELEKLEMQEAQLESELEQDIDESRKMLAMFSFEKMYTKSYWLNIESWRALRMCRSHLYRERSERMAETKSAQSVWRRLRARYQRMLDKKFEDTPTKDRIRIDNDFNILFFDEQDDIGEELDEMLAAFHNKMRN